MSGTEDVEFKVTPTSKCRRVSRVRGDPSLRVVIQVDKMRSPLGWGRAYPPILIHPVDFCGVEAIGVCAPFRHVFQLDSGFCIGSGQKGVIPLAALRTNGLVILIMC